MLHMAVEIPCRHCISYRSNIQVINLNVILGTKTNDQILIEL